jgi:fibronectin-binding autotransporter adhesin
MRRITLCLPALGLLLAIATWMPAVVSAQTTTWSPNPTDDLWSTAANWTNGVPVNGSLADVHYGVVNSGNPNTNPVVDVNPQEVGSITFDSGASAFNQSGNALTIDGISGVGVVNSSTTAQTINNAITLGGDQTWNSASGNLTFGGAIDNNSHLLTIDGSSNTTINGAISGIGGLTKNGAGTLLLNSANTFGGNVTLNSGTMTAGTNGAFANVAHSITGGTLNNNGKTNSIGNVTMSGAGSINVGAGGNLTVASLNSTDTTTSLNVGAGHFTNNSSTALTYGGNISIANGGVFQLGGAPGGSLTLTNTSNSTGSGGTVQIDADKTLISGAAGALNTANYTVNGTLNANGNNFTTTGLTGSGAVHLGAGTMTIQNTTDATHTGAIDGTAGSSIVTSSTNTANQSLNGIISGNTTITANGGTLTLGNANNSFTGNITLNTGGTVSVGDNGALGDPANQLNFQGGTLKVTGNSFTNLDGRTFNSSTFNGGFNIDAGNTFNVNQSLAGTGSLTKSGSGTLVLTGTNTYSGGTTVSDGALSGSVTGNGIGSLHGDINTTSTTANVEFNQTSNGTYTNVVSGSGNLVKIGAGTLIVTGNNNYSGTTTINGGALQIGGTNSAAGTTGSLGTGNVVNNGSLVFNRSDDMTVANNIGATSSGSLTKNGAGILTLSGTNTYAGATTVIAGRLDINGSTTSAITVPAKLSGSTTATGGTLGGNGTIVGDIVNNGIVSPGTASSPQAILNQTGSFSGNSGSSFVVNVNDDGSGSSTPGVTNSELNVDGTAALNSGSNVKVNIDGRFVRGATYTAIATTGGATVDSDVTFETNRVFVKAALDNTDTDNIGVKLSLDFVPHGHATSNQKQLGAYLNKNSSNTNSDFQDVLAALTSITTNGSSAQETVNATDIAPTPQARTNGVNTATLNGLTSVPEPNSMVLLFLGSAAFWKVFAGKSKQQ